MFPIYLPRQQTQVPLRVVFGGGVVEEDTEGRDRGTPQNDVVCADILTSPLAPPEIRQTPLHCRSLGPTKAAGFHSTTLLVNEL